MQVAIYARVSTLNQQQEGTIASQVQLLKQHIRQQNWSLLPEHEFLDEGISGARLDRPALDRLRDCAGRGEFDTVVVLSPDRLARNYAHQWLLVEEFEKLNTRLIFLQNPFGDTPQGKLLTQMQGMIAEYERAQIAERTRRGRLDKARRSEYIPWAYGCYGYRYLPKRHGCAPQVTIDPTEAEVVRGIYRALIEEQLSCRQITKRLNEAKVPTPTGKNQVWQPATVRQILTNRVYAGTARYNYRQQTIPTHRRVDEQRLRNPKTGRRYRPEAEWVTSESPAIITPEIFEKARLQLQRNAEAARKQYQPSSARYLLRTLVKCGECNLAMFAFRQPSKCKKYEYFYYQCSGRQLLTRGRTTKCEARTVRADRLDSIVWQSLSELLHNPEVIPQLHQTWADAKQQNISSLAAQQSQLLQRRQRIERQDQRLLDAYQAEAINLAEMQARRQKLSTELQQIEQEIQRLANARQQTVHWQQVIDNAETFRKLLGDNLERLSFEERQAVTQCLIKKVVVTGEEVDIHFVLPFESTPQAVNLQSREPEGAPGHFYGLRLPHLDSEPASISLPAFFRRPVELNHYKEQPLGATLVSLGALCGCEDAADSQCRREFFGCSLVELVLGSITLSPLAQGSRSTLFAAYRTRDQRWLVAAAQILVDRDAGKTFVEIEATDLQSAQPHCASQLSQHIHDLLLRQDEANCQGHALSVDNRVSRGHAIETRCSGLRLAAHPEALLLFLLAIVRAVVKINGDLDRTTAAQLLRPVCRQPGIDTTLQLRQFFDGQLLIDVAANRLWVWRASQFATDRFNCPTIGRHANQDIIERLALAAVTIRLRRQMLFQGLLCLTEYFFVIELRLIIRVFFTGLSFPSAFGFRSKSLKDSDKPFLSIFTWPFGQIWIY